MNIYERKIRNENKRHKEQLTAISDDLERNVFNMLHSHGNFLMLPDKSKLYVYIIDAVGRREKYRVHAVGNTVDDHVIFVTTEALDEEYRDNPEAQDANSSYTVDAVKKSKFWWYFDEPALTLEDDMISNKLSVLSKVYDILYSTKK